MRTSRKNYIERLRSRAGETIAETLVALLISSIGLMMLASMITSSAQLITKSRSVLKEYYAESNQLEEKGESGAGSFDVVLAFPGSDLQPETAAVTYYENAAIGAKPVISYKLADMP
ncbi:MAG: hypothetical protein IJG52_00195 [Lachnospiraceae bacterium]|nr:hypothetical protein [Lachnospiraceae bacterium]MBQ3391815.1 hypothetical protein [Lachnospiraceae bacterium]